MNKGLLIALVAVAAVIAVLVFRPADESSDAPAEIVLQGVDMSSRTVRIGTLNDESGPAAAIGRPFAVGKRILAQVVNAGGSGILPDGWRIELVERDHGYNPQHAVQAYNEIKDDVLFIGTSFGTPNTLPLRPLLERDNLIAFPASLSSKMAEHQLTPPLGTPYKAEAARAVNWAVEHVGEDKGKLALGIIYQQDDYGADGLAGVNEAAERHGVKVVSRQAVAPGQTDYTAVVSALREAGANYVLLTTLPSGTGPILGTAAQLQYMPIWIGSTPAWIDRFFDPAVIPPVVFTNFYWVTGLPYWGEEVPGMDKLIAAYEKHGQALNPPDFYILASYVQGLIQLEGFKRAIAAGDLSRAGYKRAMQTIENWDADGLIQPVNLSQFPYETGMNSRVLKPNMAERGWKVVAPYASPEGGAAVADAATEAEVVEAAQE
jgi:ABC-type branched-subunit amino acid transport system substrate-binding protein